MSPPRTCSMCARPLSGRQRKYCGTCAVLAERALQRRRKGVRTPATSDCAYCGTPKPTYRHQITCGNAACRRKHATILLKKHNRKRRGQTLNNRKCAGCEKSIEHKRYDAKFCGAVCSRQHKRIIATIRRRMDNRCIDCGRMMLDKQINAERCAPCKLKYTATNYKQYYADNKDRIRTQERVRKAKKRAVLKAALEMFPELKELLNANPAIDA